jgi:hypothetical protein
LSTAAEFLSIVEGLGLSDVEAGALVGIAPATCRIVRLTREMPKHPRPRVSIAAWVSANRSATSRAELRMTASAVVEPSEARSSLDDHLGAR